MRVITYTCPDCGTIVAGNELLHRRVLECPGLDCETVLRFSDLDQEQREHLTEHSDQYRI